jgi:uncharacterized protein (DUF169 family)
MLFSVLQSSYIGEVDMPISPNRKEERVSLKNLINLQYAPIAINLGRIPPPDLPQLEGKMEFCRMWTEAQKGKAFFVTAENHDCFPGMYHLGLRGESEKEAVCRFWVERVYAYSHSAVKKYAANVPHLNRNLVGVICMSPLEKAVFEPDLVIIRCRPEQAMHLLWAYSHNTGETVQGETGTAMCSTLVVKPYLNKKPSFSVGDPGGTYIVGLAEEELLVSVPYNLYYTMIKTLQLHIQDWKS